MNTPAFAKNKGSGQLCGTDQCLCFCFIHVHVDITLPLVLYFLKLRFQASSHILLFNAARFVLDMVRKPDDSFSHDAAQMTIRLLHNEQLL